MTQTYESYSIPCGPGCAGIPAGSTGTAFQTDLWGNQHVAGDIVDRITHILETVPEARNDYKALMALYWITFDGLRELLGDVPIDIDKFYQWFVHSATSPKTIQNRCMEIQTRTPRLDADQLTRQCRERQATAGIIR